MNLRHCTSAAVFAFACAAGVAEAAGAHEGVWIGGVWAAGETVFVRIALGGEGQLASGRADFPERNEWSILLERVKVEGDRVRFEVPGLGASLRFDGELEGDRITGTARQDMSTANFELLRTGPVDWTDFDRVAGDYEFDDAGVVLVYRSPQGPAYVDYRTGRTGLLFRLADGRFVAGSSLLRGFPVESTFEFDRGGDREAVALVRSDKRGTKRGARRHLYRQEEVRFEHGDVSLAGTLLLPHGAGPHPAVVMIHGSGPATRDVFLPVADVLARNGVAVLLHDKRGTGASSGNYHRADFDDLAGDAAAGVAWLAGHPEIDSRRIGLHGFSLGCWVAPLAAAKSERVAFVIVEAAPATTPAEHERLRVERQMRADGQPNASIARAISFMDQKFKVGRTGQGWEALVRSMKQGERDGWLRYVNAPVSLENLRWNWHHVLSYDPRPALEALRCPVLALYGGRDTTVSPGIHLARMRDALSRAATRDATIRELPGANHHFYAAHTGGPSEVNLLQGFVDGYFDTRVEWLRERVDAVATFTEPAGSFR